MDVDVMMQLYKPIRAMVYSGGGGVNILGYMWINIIKKKNVFIRL